MDPSTCNSAANELTSQFYLSRQWYSSFWWVSVVRTQADGSLLGGFYFDSGLSAAGIEMYVTDNGNHILNNNGLTLVIFVLCENEIVLPN